MVPNNSAARLLIFKIFSLPTRLIWTYTLIKIQIIFLPTRLLSTIFYIFLSIFNAFCSLFCYHCFKNAFFSCIFILLLKALVVKNSVLHDFGFGKVSQIHETFLMELQLFGWRHFSKTEVVQNTVLNH